MRDLRFSGGKDWVFLRCDAV